MRYCSVLPTASDIEPSVAISPTNAVAAVLRATGGNQQDGEVASGFCDWSQNRNPGTCIQAQMFRLVTSRSWDDCSTSARVKSSVPW